MFTGNSRQIERLGLQHGVNTSFIIVPSNILVSCIQLKHRNVSRAVRMGSYVICIHKQQGHSYNYMSCITRKPDFCLSAQQISAFVFAA